MAQRLHRQCLIVAMDIDGGIGKNGVLPWNLRKDMQRFVNLTSSTTNPRNRNVVIMGRKCWESIPVQYRPLKGRLNIVLSNTLKPTHNENLIVCNDISQLDALIDSLPNIERIWNIGGKEVYKWALDDDRIETIYLTRIHRSFETDVKLSGIAWENFEEDMQEREGPFTENGTCFTFHTYRRVSMGGGSNRKKKSESSERRDSAAFSHTRSSRPNGENSTAYRYWHNSRKPGVENNQNRSGGDSKRRASCAGEADKPNENVFSCSNGQQRQTMSGNTFGSSTSLNSTSAATAATAVANTTVSVQTEKSSDFLLTFLALPQEERVEALCEVLSAIDPLETRLASVCLAGIASTQASQLKHLEMRSNSLNAIEYLRDKLVCRQMDASNYSDYIDIAWVFVALLGPSNRTVAMQYIGLIERLLSERYALDRYAEMPSEGGSVEVRESAEGVGDEETQKIDRIAITIVREQYKLDILKQLFKLITACIHHPAFPGDFRVRMTLVSEDLRTEIRETTRNANAALAAAAQASAQLDPNTSNVGIGIANAEMEAVQNLNSIENSSWTSTVSQPMHYISRFETYQPTSEEDDHFCIQIVWNDGERTFTSRTRKQILDLHYKLLDLYGEETRQRKSEEVNIPKAENRSMSDAATPTLIHSHSISSSTIASETISASRLLPYLKSDASAETIAAYINDLSNLPARIMMSPLIYQEFYASRFKTRDLEQASANTGGPSVLFPQFTSLQNKQPTIRHLSNYPLFAMHPPPPPVLPSASLPSPTAVTLPPSTLPTSGNTVGSAANNSGGSMAAQEQPYAAVPLRYSRGVDPTSFQVFYPSCSNCGEQHPYYLCQKPTLLDEKFRIAQ